MAEPTLACASYPSKYFSCRVFSDISSHRIASLLHWELLTTSSPAGPLLLKTYAFPPNMDFSAHDGTNCRFFLGEPHLDSLSPRCKHSAPPLRPGHCFPIQSSPSY